MVEYRYFYEDGVRKIELITEPTNKVVRPATDEDLGIYPLPVEPQPVRKAHENHKRGNDK